MRGPAFGSNEDFGSSPTTQTETLEICHQQCVRFVIYNRRIKGPVYTEHQRQRCDDATDTALIENNGVTRKWVATPIWSHSIAFSQSNITSVIVVDA